MNIQIMTVRWGNTCLTITRKFAEEIGADIIDTNEEQAPFNVNKDANTHNTGGVIMGDRP